MSPDVHRRQFLKGTAAMMVPGLWHSLCGTTQAGLFREKKFGTGDLDTALRILEYGGQHSEATKQFYTAAYHVLSQDPNTTFADVAADPAVNAIAEQNRILHTGGPMLGDITPTGAKVWIRTFCPAAVTVQVEKDGRWIDFGPVNTTAESDLAAVVSVAGLTPATSYPYRVLVDKTRLTLPDDAMMTTTLDSQKGQTARIAFGTCQHRLGLANADLTNTILSRKPAALLLGGDIAVQDRNNHCGLHRADYLLRDCLPPWQQLSARVPVYARWDDHDYFDDDLAGIPKGYTDTDRQNVCKVFRGSWNNPLYGADKGVFFRTRLGPCDVIKLDSRYFRSKPGDPNALLGSTQMDWLERQLLDCKGPFVILSCSTMWSDYVSNGKDSWGKYDKAGRERILNFIEEHRIPGVILISGDRHGARGFRIPRPSGYEFFEFEVASLGGRFGPPVNNPKWTTQLYGVADVSAFGEFSIDAAMKDPQVTFRLISDSGKVLYECTLKQSQLTPPERDPKPTAPKSV